MLHLQYFNEYAREKLSLNAIWRIYRPPTTNQYFHNIIFVFLPPANEVWGKVIFLHLCVILFIGGVCFPACITGHMTRGSASVGGLHLGGLHLGGLHLGRSASGKGNLHTGGTLPRVLWDMVNKWVVYCFLFSRFLLRIIWHTRMSARLPHGEFCFLS